ncbi:MAG: hypothetical protein NDI94_02490 [Candidatus Woesearchaeota archaeon]|nr:hypothetical protein [Candidatus Woesearchaeota archaeon]
MVLEFIIYSEKKANELITSEDFDPLNFGEHYYLGISRTYMLMEVDNAGRTVNTFNGSMLVSMDSTFESLIQYGHHLITGRDLGQYQAYIGNLYRNNERICELIRNLKKPDLQTISNQLDLPYDTLIYYLAKFKDKPINEQYLSAKTLELGCGYGELSVALGLLKGVLNKIDTRNEYPIHTAVDMNNLTILYDSFTPFLGYNVKGYKDQKDYGVALALRRLEILLNPKLVDLYAEKVTLDDNGNLPLSLSHLRRGFHIVFNAAGDDASGSIIPSSTADVFNTACL